MKSSCYDIMTFEEVKTCQNITKKPRPFTRAKKCGFK